MPKSIIIKAISPCAVSKYKKDFDRIEVEVHREVFDDWNEVELSIPDNVELPKSGRQFSTKAMGIEHNVLEISDDSHIQIRVITEINDEEIEETINEHEEEDDWEDEWELVGVDYIISEYEIIGN